MTKCPVCKRQGMTRVATGDGLSVLACDACGGQWLSRKDYEAWLSAHGETLPEKAYSEVKFDIEDVHDAKVCPDCSRFLLKYRVGHGLDFYVDHCGSCGGVWLDKHEWNALKDKNLHDEIHRVFSTHWQADVRKEQMSDCLDSVYRSRFGEKDYEMARQVRSWIQASEDRDALIRFLADDDPYAV
ncbi:MAG: zf-TFIIB domain-containing protein [Verrucomicrobia bacterium]|nr:zf-TFIIB domain-containing protein [Verrucomicrobiota bacterium]MDA1086017.1 zf-TFIIB domain-containing protein [Verrucomicrobiota bacterium]